MDTAFSLNEDINRRDFTINSLYLDSKGNLIDLLNGKHDINKRKLVFIGDPIERIEEDYLRIIRFCRLSGNFNTNISIAKNISAKITNHFHNSLIFTSIFIDSSALLTESRTLKSFKLSRLWYCKRLSFRS